VKSRIHQINHFLLALSVLFSPVVIAAANTPDKITSTKQQPSVFATIGKETISWQDFETAYRKSAKTKFYHGKPADEVIAELQRSVGDELIVNALLLNEANRRKLKPDADYVNQELNKVEKQFANDEQWKQAKTRVLPTITKRFQNESLVKKLESIVRQIQPPTDAQVQSYYTGHPDKFTAPIEQRVSLILLSVDPSSTTETWQQITEDAKTLIKRIRDGEDFAELAKQYSKDDQTVDQGGDMGYLHEGMLPGLPQESVNNLKVGEISEPIRLLQGVAIFRLTERKSPGLSSFESVKQRVTELWLAEARDNKWNALIANLRKKTPMHIDESRFLPLAAQPTAGTNTSLPNATAK
jgi:peptidyl-prolyl cis-trans isomerase C